MAGRASSKDWKRSIRYAGRPLQCLIQVRTPAPPALRAGQQGRLLGPQLDSDYVSVPGQASSPLCLSGWW